MKRRTLQWSLLALSRIVLADVPLPYNPTRVLRAPNSTTVYILKSSSNNANQGVLQSVDVSGTFSSNNLSPDTLSQNLPFLKDGPNVPYLPVIDALGNISVVTGSCSSGVDSTTIWRYDGQWAQQRGVTTQLSNIGNLTGVNFLSSGVAFTADVGNSETELGLYVFGGMCPASNSTSATWQSDAEYSQSMLVYTAGEARADSWSVSNSAARGPPIAEAGFTMTGLPPTYRVNATGAAQTQQQDFLLLGGHTQDAFLNTSQVALFSLPQNSWSYLPVQQPSSERTDLTVRTSGATSVEPRSGHTAVLTDDGSKIVVFGGWVGDVTNPAQPQLAVLNLGSEYGGDNELAWTWTVPSPPSGGLAEGSGLYGHGAAMLPGGVMMIVGGYSIPASSSSRLTKRQSQATDQVLLFNATSNEWMASYTNPTTETPANESNSGGGALSKTSQQAGLGLGLGLGVLVIVVLILAYFWYARRLKKKRDERQQALVHSTDGSFLALDQPFLDHGSVHDRRQGPYAAIEDNPPEMQHAASTGLFVDVPSPTRGLRNGLANRPYTYHQAPRYDESRSGNKGSGNIHPILERQDEDESERNSTSRDPFLDPSSPALESGEAHDRFSPAEVKLQELQRVLNSGTGSSPVRDPFHDPHPNPLGSNPHPPRSPNATDTLRRVPTYMAREQVVERKPLPMPNEANWEVIDAEEGHSGGSSGAAIAPASWTGRISPTKTDDRTSSTLSDRSTRSHASSTSITRTMSTRTGALLAAALARRDAEITPGTTPVEARTATMTTTASSSGRKSPYYFYGAHTESQRKSKRESKRPVLEPIHNADKSTESFMTAHSSFLGLQQEGKALLGGSPTLDRDDPYHRALAAHGQSGQKSEAEASSPPHRRQGWMGSIRRALTTAMNDRSFSLTSQSKGTPDELPEPRTSSSSPSRSHRPRGVSDAPRRAISDGGALLKQKRGQKDWDPSNPCRDDPELDGDWGEATRTSLEVREAEIEWDVEGAAAERDVQVMFTIPKSRLRVVNADIERASMRSASDGAISRKASMLSLNHQSLAAGGVSNAVQLSRGGSTSTTRSRSGGDLELRERESQMEIRMRALLSSGSRIEERERKSRKAV